MTYRCLESGHLEATNFLTKDPGMFLQTELEQFQKLLPHPFNTIHKWKVPTNKLPKEQFKLRSFALHWYGLGMLLWMVTVSQLWAE